MNTNQQTKAKAIVALVADEYINARKKFPPFNSYHEGYAVLLEEVDELWDEIKKNASIRDYKKIFKEAIQVGAMSLAIIIDLENYYGFE